MDTESHQCYYCGSVAHYQLKNGRWCCHKIAACCPTNRKLVSAGVKVLWKRRHDAGTHSPKATYSDIGLTQPKPQWDGIHCEYGCGQEAKFTMKNGKHCCSKYPSGCPAVKKRNGASVSKVMQTKVADGTFVSNLAAWRSDPNYHVWNKGLTAETSEAVRKWQQSFKKSLSEGKVKLAWKGKKMPLSARQRMSDSARKRTDHRVSKRRIEYVCKDSSVVIMDSSAEVKVGKILDEHSIRWIRPPYIPWYDDDGKEHHYFADFYLLDFDLYLDPKNDYCFKVQAYKIEKLKQLYTNVEFIREGDINYEYIEQLISKRKNV